MTSTSINNNPTPAQEEFQSFIDKNTDQGSRVHPEDRDDHDSDHSEQDEEDHYRNAQIEEAMRAPVIRSGDLRSPAVSREPGRAPGGTRGFIAGA